MSDVFDALSHPVRRRVLELLRGGGRTAGALAAEFPYAPSTMSAHFAKLKAAGLVRADPRGAEIVYTLNLSLAEEVLGAFLGRLRVGEAKPESELPAQPQEVR